VMIALGAYLGGDDDGVNDPVEPAGEGDKP